MTKIVKRILIVTVSIGCLIVISKYIIPSLIVGAIQQSHIEANTPEDDEFNKIITRDLTAYFASKGYKQIQVKFEFLRKGPTQSGVAYPKYYLWTNVIRGDKSILQGAARIAAIEKTRIDVTHFLSREEIRKNNQLVYEVFPKLLCNDIIERSK